MDDGLRRSDFEVYIEQFTEFCIGVLVQHRETKLRMAHRLAQPCPVVEMDATINKLLDYVASKVAEQKND